MQNALRIILLAWFIIVSALVLFPSAALLYDAGSAPRASAPNRPTRPKGPVPPPLAVTTQPANVDDATRQRPNESYKLQVDMYSSQVVAFGHEIAAYNQEMSAYKQELELSGQCAKVATYRLVVKETLVTLTTTFLAAIIAYAFTNAGATVLNNSLLALRRQPLDKVKLL